MLYCPYCLQTYNDNDKEIYPYDYNCLNQKHCSGCYRDVTLEPIPHSEDYYKLLSMQQYNNEWNDYKLIEEDIMQNPFFDQESYNKRQEQINRHQAKVLNNMLNNNPNWKGGNKHQPKCPVCSSPNIRKISITKRAIHGTAFGLFSKTARSQWECLNCGNKF